MKKNYVMRIAAVLLVLVLLSTCVVSGTFAKYVTAGNASDSATIAKWGVTVEANTSTVATVTEIGGAAEAQVKSATPEVILAPGTEVAKLADFTISGTPEVAVSVSYTADLVLAGWALSGGTYYCPLEVTVNSTVYAGKDYTSMAAFEAAVEAAIAAVSAEYAVSSNLSTAVAPQVSVAWAFNGGNDSADTYLGNQASIGNAPTVSLTITATVTQID